MKRTRIYVLAFAAVAVLASAHLYEIERGVHFKGGIVDFGMPPHREAMYCGDSMNDYARWRPGTVYLGFEYSDEEQPDLISRRTTNDIRKMQSLQTMAAKGDLLGALRGLRKMVSLGRGDASWLRERIELIVDGQKANDKESVVSFLRGRSPSSPWIAPYIQYDRLAAQPSTNARGKRLVELADRFPQRKRAEPALITAARDFLESPQADDTSSGAGALDLLATGYPKSRFISKAQGLRGRIFCLHGDDAAAIRSYERQLQMGAQGKEATDAIVSIILCEERQGRPYSRAFWLCRLLNYTRRPDLRGYAYQKIDDTLKIFSAHEAKEFWARIRQFPDALSSYLDYRLGFSHPTKELPELAGKASIFGPYAAHVFADLSEACYRLHLRSQCASFAEECLKSQPAPADRAQATYLQASLAKSAGQRLRAIALYNEVLGVGHTYLGCAARENLGPLYEKIGRLDRALDQYFALGYEYDVAYMLDIRMTPEQIADYIRSRPDHLSLTSTRFALGIRYLRQHRFSAATATLASIPTWKRRAFLTYLPKVYEDDVSMRLQDPLKTSKDLAGLYAVAGSTQGSIRAKSLLAIENYYYDHRNLLLYNPKLWRGDRAVAIDFSWNALDATNADREALWKHHCEHECLWQALNVAEEVARDYPNSPSAQAASYRGACAAWRLSNLDEYWRWVADTSNLRVRAVNFMSRATRGANRVLAKSAAKYAVVYLDEIKDLRANYQGSLPNRHWVPYDQIPHQESNAQ